MTVQFSKPLQVCCSCCAHFSGLAGTWAVGSPLVSVHTGISMLQRVKSMNIQLSDQPRISYTTLWDHLPELPSSMSPTLFGSGASSFGSAGQKARPLVSPVLFTSCNWVCLCSQATRRYKKKKSWHYLCAIGTIDPVLKERLPCLGVLIVWLLLPWVGQERMGNEQTKDFSDQ